MHFPRGVCIAVLHLIFVHARSENLYYFDSFDSDWNDPASNDLFWDLPEVNDYSSDYTVDLPTQEFTTDSWDFASLPACDSQSSLTDDFLQARDALSCPSKEPEGKLNLPTGLFQDPLQFLDNGLKTPPTGLDSQPGSGSEDEDLNFNSFINSRPASVLNYPEDESICPPRFYGLSNTPVCHHPYRRSSPSNGEGLAFTLYDITPCTCLSSKFPCIVCLSAIADAPE